MPNSRHSIAIFSPSSSRAMNFSRSSIGLHSFQGTFALLAKSPMCNPCARNELSPISQEGHLMRQPAHEEELEERPGDIEPPIFAAPRICLRQSEERKERAR